MQSARGQLVRPSVTVADVLRLALPPGTRVACGHQHLPRPISWVRALLTRPYQIGGLDKDTLVLLSLRGLNGKAELQRLPRLAEALLAARVSSLVLSDESPEVSEVAARADTVSVLVLPPDVAISEVEKSVIALILDRQSQIERRTAEIYEQLIHLALQGEPVQVMADALATTAGRVVFLEDEYGALQALAVPEDYEARSLPGAAEAAGLYSAAEVLGVSLPLVVPPIYGEGAVRRVLGNGTHAVRSIPIRLGAAVVGFLTLLGRRSEMEDLDDSLVVRTASAFAIPIAQQRAVIETQTRLQGSFLESLFGGATVNEEEIIERARYLGHNLREPYDTACLAVDESRDGGKGLTEAQRATLWASFLDIARRELLAQWPRALLKDRGELLAVLTPADGVAASAVRQSFESVRAELGLRAGGATATVGVGPRAEGPQAILRSCLQAEQAARIGRHFLGGNRTVAFENLGTYRLLASIEDRDALDAFYQEYLGPLEAYDARYKAELVETLEGFFQANANHARAADSLHLHRNTLLYRLTRIAALTGRNLEDPETRLCLQLALKIRHLGPARDARLATFE